MSKNWGFPIFKTGRNLCKPDISFSEMSKALLDFIPRPGLMLIRPPIFSKDQRHRNERCIYGVFSIVPWINDTDPSKLRPLPIIRDSRWNLTLIYGLRYFIATTKTLRFFCLNLFQ